MSNNIMPFFHSTHPFSNWYPAQFVVFGIEFDCVEQMMMYCKAVTFNDYVSARKIMLANTPRGQKALGRKVLGYDDAIWTAKRELYVDVGCFAKFSQNDSLKKYILSTGDIELVEASPYDRIWGVGIAENDPDIFDKSKWLGQNLLGKCLMRVRNQLRIQDGI